MLKGVVLFARTLGLVAIPGALTVLMFAINERIDGFADVSEFMRIILTYYVAMTSGWFAGHLSAKLLGEVDWDANPFWMLPLAITSIQIMKGVQLSFSWGAMFIGSMILVFALVRDAPTKENSRS